ncbi:hypothetical protein ABID23_001386 [Bartonella silvatica]|uniref:Uncharacterized protein n=1 Tax=Bartonella silvatica TaxID=357760 RepID=A0ABV2HIA8_9HYPH
MAATGAAGHLILGHRGGIDLQSRQGAIAAENIYGAGDITLFSHHGISVLQTILSHHNIAIHTQADAAVHFGQLIAYENAKIESGAVDFSSLMTGQDAVLKVGSLDAGALMTGVDFVSSALNPSGDLILHDHGSLSVTAQEGITVGQIASGGDIALFVDNDIYYIFIMIRSLVWHSHTDIGLWGDRLRGEMCG